MNCDHFERLLHLNRTGELSSREAELLRQHLRVCEKCVIAQRRIAEGDLLMSQLRSATPVPASPEKLTADIMRRVRLSASEIQSAGLIDRVLDFFSLPSVRIATMALTCVAVGLFTVQYLAMLNDIHNLEASAMEKSHSAPASAEVYSLQMRSSQELTRLSKDLQKLVPSSEYTLADNQILIRQSSLSSVLSSPGVGSITTTVASSLLHIEKSKLDRIIEYATKHASAIVNLEH
jgi:hypothetical protein